LRDGVDVFRLEDGRYPGGLYLADLIDAALALLLASCKFPCAVEFVDKVTAAVVVIIVLGLYEFVKAPGGKVSGDTVLGVIIAPAPCSLYLAERFCVIALVPRRGKEFVE
jgi:hypothetical protein